MVENGNRTELELARLAREAAEQAGDLVREAFRTKYQVEEKSSAIDLVTEIDRASEKLISSLLLSSIPESVVLGEEYGATSEAEGGLRWHVDPIDGTHNFVIGEPSFVVSIGIEQGGELVGGVVHDPIHRETFWAAGTQSWLNDEPLPTASQFSGYAGALTSQPLHGLKVRDEDLPDYLELLRSLGFVRNPGSYALHIAHVAAGRSTVAFEMTGANPWDIAGGMAVAKANGCTITKLVDSTPGFGNWGAHSYLVTRDARDAARLAPVLRSLLRRGTPPPRFAV